MATSCIIKRKPETPRPAETGEASIPCLLNAAIGTRKAMSTKRQDLYLYGGANPQGVAQGVSTYSFSISYISKAYITKPTTS